MRLMRVVRRVLDALGMLDRDDPASQAAVRT